MFRSKEKVEDQEDFGSHPDLHLAEGHDFGATGIGRLGHQGLECFTIVLLILRGFLGFGRVPVVQEVGGPSSSYSPLRMGATHETIIRQLSSRTRLQRLFELSLYDLLYLFNFINKLIQVIHFVLIINNKASQKH